MRLACGIIITLLVAATVHADSVKLGGFWIDNVTVRDVVEGSIVYTTSTGRENARPIGAVQGLRLDAFPQLATAQTAAAKGDHDAALADYNKVIRSARQKWVKHWATSHKIALLDQHGAPLEAVGSYLALVKDEAEPFYLGSAPLSAIRRADAKQLTVIAQRLAKVRSASRKRLGEQYKMMLDLVKLRQAEFAQQQPTIKPAQTPAKSDEPMPTPKQPVALQTTQDDGESAVVLPSFMEASDPITAMLRGGRFREAVEAAQGRLQKREPRMAMRLYQLGVAQLNLALPSNNKQQLLDAGLSFMRSIIYFSKSRYKGPAMIEAGLIHQKIDRPKIAAELWRKARIEIDAEEEPELIQRLDELQGVDADDQSDEQSE